MGPGAGPCWAAVVVEPETVHGLRHWPVVCFEPYQPASLQETGGDYAPGSVAGAVAVVLLLVGLREVFVLEQSEGEDAVSELGGDFGEEWRLALGVASGEVLGRGVCFDADLFGCFSLDPVEIGSVVLRPVRGVGCLCSTHCVVVRSVWCR
jgi:hypothetical protein